MDGWKSVLPGYGAGLSPQFGAVGVAAIGNNPGSLIYSNGWADNGGRLWLFGG